MLVINSQLSIPDEELELSYARSSGPGGQNVNKVSSKAILRWPATRNTSLPVAVRERFLRKYASRLTTEGDLVLNSQRYRDQRRNVDDVRQKLSELVLSVASAPKKRRATKPTRASLERRLEAKQVRSKTKQRRRAVRVE